MTVSQSVYAAAGAYVGILQGSSWAATEAAHGMSDSVKRMYLSALHAAMSIVHRAGYSIRHSHAGHDVGQLNDYGMYYVGRFARHVPLLGHVIDYLGWDESGDMEVVEVPFAKEYTESGRLMTPDEKADFDARLQATKEVLEDDIINQNAASMLPENGNHGAARRLMIPDENARVDATEGLLGEDGNQSTASKIPAPPPEFEPATPTILASQGRSTHQGHLPTQPEPRGTMPPNNPPSGNDPLGTVSALSGQSPLESTVPDYPDTPTMAGPGYGDVLRPQHIAPPAWRAFKGQPTGAYSPPMDESADVPADDEDSLALAVDRARNEYRPLLDSVYRDIDNRVPESVLEGGEAGSGVEHAGDLDGVLQRVARLKKATEYVKSM